MIDLIFKTVVNFGYLDQIDADFRNISVPSWEDYCKLSCKKEPPFEVRKFFGIKLANRFWDLIKNEDIFFWDKMIIEGVVDWRDDSEIFSLEKIICELKKEAGLIGSEIVKLICGRYKLVSLVKNSIKNPDEAKNYFELIGILTEIQDNILKFSFNDKFCLRNRILFLLNEAVMNGVFDVMIDEIKKGIKSGLELKDFLQLFSRKIINFDNAQYGGSFLPKGVIDMKEFEMIYDLFFEFDSQILEGVKKDFGEIIKLDEVLDKEIEKDLRFINNWKDFVDEKIIIEYLGSNFGFKGIYHFKFSNELFVNFSDIKVVSEFNAFGKYARFKIDLNGENAGRLFFINTFCAGGGVFKEDLEKYLVAVFFRSLRLKMEKFLGIEIYNDENEKVNLIKEQIESEVQIVSVGEVNEKIERQVLSLGEKRHLVVKILMQKSGREVLEIMEGVGLKVVRSRGSHFILRNEKGVNMPLPLHSDGVSKGVLFRFVKKMGIGEKLIEKLGV